MNKIPVVSWMKMITIVLIHLSLVGWVCYYYREPIGSCASAACDYLTDGYDACERFVVDAWGRVPSFDQLRDGFIGILKLEPFR